jgi:hypothetical protein
VLVIVLLNGVSHVVLGGIDYVKRREHPHRVSPVYPFYGASLTTLYPGHS